MNILLKKPSILLDEFLSDYNSLFSIDIEETKKKINDNLKFYDGLISESPSSRLEEIWYNHLINTPDYYSIYDHEEYFIDLWCCFKLYSRDYLKKVYKAINENDSVKKNMVNIRSVLDLGCGIGYSTVILKEIFPESTTYGYNLKNSKQYVFCEYISKKFDFNVIHDLTGISDVDVIFASEYFEHFERPIEHFYDIVKLVNPKFIILANSFNTRSAGHFLTYKNDDLIIDQKDISRLFNKFLLSAGYSKLGIRVFNNKPSFYICDKIDR